jgi:hypothetical protein
VREGRWLVNKQSLLLLLTAWAAAGCDRAGAPQPAVHVRDSAGVRIVENVAPAWTAANAWAIGDEPRLVVGQTMGPAEYELHGVTGASLLLDGRIAVALNSAGQIRLFDDAGVFELAFGRTGGGPGEFSMVGSVRDGPDGRIWVWDHWSGRMSFFDRQGRFQESVSIPDAGPMVTGLVGVLDDGSLILRMSRTERIVASGPHREPHTVTLFNPRTARTDTILTLRGTELLHVVLENGASNRNRVLFGRTSSLAVRTSTLVFGDTDAFELTVARPDGTVATIIRKRHEPVPVTSADVRRAREELLAGIGPGTPPTLARLRQTAASRVPARETLPAFGTILVDADDNLWVEHARFPWDLRQLWHVFDAEGRWLGDTETPEGLTVRQIGSDFILGTARDEWGAPFVAIYDLLKPS